MSVISQPALACPACGYSLRGQPPIEPGQILRCPECGSVTSIADLAARHLRRQRDLRRLAMMMLITAALVTLFALLRRSPFMLISVERPFTAFGFFLGAGVSLLQCAMWDHPPRSTRVIFILGGGAAMAAAAGLSPFLILMAYLWWFGWHLWASKRGYV
jgi:hypothetical protein